MTTLAQSTNFDGSSLFGRFDDKIAQSEAANTIQDAVSSAWKSLESPSQMLSILGFVKNEIYEIREEYAEENVDCSALLSVIDLTSKQAKSFSYDLPMVGHLPSVSVDQKGQVGFYWRKDEMSSMYITFMGKDKILCAGITKGLEFWYEDLYADSISKNTLDRIKATI